MTDYDTSSPRSEVTESEGSRVTKARSTWSKQHKDVLRDYYAQGKSISTIAHELGHTPGSVKTMLSRMGLKRSAPSINPDSQTVSTMSKKRAKERDIASRIASLLGESPKIEVEARVFSDLELMRFADRDNDGLQIFLHDLLDIELQDYQLDIARALQGTKNLVVVSGRQIGKDYVIATFALWESIVRPNSKIVIVSAAERQSFLLNDRILSFIAGNDQLYVTILKASRDELRFKNGSAVYFLPATGYIRGYTEVTRVFVNEARDVPDTTYDAITPMLSRRNGHLAVFSTPLGRVGHLWDIWNSPLYEKVHVRSEQNAYLDKDFLKGEQERMSNASYQCEYEGEFVSSQTNYFEPTSIQKALVDYTLTLQREDGKTYAIGIDWGRKVDASVMTVVSRDPSGALKVEYIKSYEGVSFQDQLPTVGQLRDTFGPIAIVAEETGLGLGPCDALERSGVRILRFKTTNESKTKIYDNLRKLFNRLEITIPMDPFRLKHELTLLEYEALPSGAIRIGHGSGGHDDFSDSLALACWAFTFRTEPFSLRITQRPANPFVNPYAPKINYREF